MDNLDILALILAQCIDAAPMSVCKKWRDLITKILDSDYCLGDTHIQVRYAIHSMPKIIFRMASAYDQFRLYDFRAQATFVIVCNLDPEFRIPWKYILANILINPLLYRYNKDIIGRSTNLEHYFKNMFMRYEAYRHYLLKFIPVRIFWEKVKTEHAPSGYSGFCELLYYTYMTAWQHRTCELEQDVQTEYM